MGYILSYWTDDFNNNGMLHLKGSIKIERTVSESR